MVYRRTMKRRAFRRLRRSKRARPTVKSVVRRVRKIERNIETKTFTTFHSLSPIGTAVTAFLDSQPSITDQGPNADEFIGRKYRSVGVAIRGQATKLGLNNTISNLRFMGVWWKGAAFDRTAGNTFTAMFEQKDHLNTTIPNTIAPFRSSQRSNAKVLWDFRIPLGYRGTSDSVVGGQQFNKTFKFYKRINMDTVFDTAGIGVTTSFTTGQLIIYIMDTSAASASIAFTAKFYYKDS